MGEIYYRNIKPQCVMYFFVNQKTRNIEGVITEIKTDTTMSVRKGKHGSMWNDIDNNAFAQELIKTSAAITEEEYNEVNEIADGFLDKKMWITTDYEDIENALKPVKQEELVTEVVYC